MAVADNPHGPKVWHRFDPDLPTDAVKITRGTPYGNPFIIGQHGNREECIEQYKELILSQPDMIRYIIKTLQNQDLECSCKPLPCHGDFLLEVANGGIQFRNF